LCQITGMPGCGNAPKERLSWSVPTLSVVEVETQKFHLRHRRATIFYMLQRFRRYLSPDRSVIRAIAERRLTYLSPEKLWLIADTCRALDAKKIAGSFIEAGAALGGSAALIAKVKHADRPLAIYDVFGMIPAPTADDPPEVHERYRIIAQG
jgi:hypothetical protein